MGISREERLSREYWIYFLRDPDTMQVVYVGSSSNPNRRFSNHMSALSGNVPKDEFVRSLKEQGKRFVFQLAIGPVSYRSALVCERRLISAFVSAGNPQILNLEGTGRYYDRCEKKVIDTARVGNRNFPTQSHDDSDDHLYSSDHAPVADFADKVNAALEVSQ